VNFRVVDRLAMDMRPPVREAVPMNLPARVLPVLVATCLLPCGSALAATPAKAKPKPAAKGHVGIGSAWGPVVVHPSHPTAK